MVYRIGKDDIISDVSGNWSAFAHENAGDCIARPERVVGLSIFDFITGMETTHLYEILISKGRAMKRSIEISFRCDSPMLRRFLKLSILPIENDGIEFRSELMRTQPRESVDLLRSDIERSDDFLRICSMCKKISVADDKWLETEIAIEQLGLFSRNKMPQLTHGLCPTCYKAAIAELD